MKDFTELFNKGPVVIFQWKNETHWPVVFITDNVLELTGYSKEEPLSGVVSNKEIIHPEDLKRVDREVAEGSRAGVARFSHTPYRIVSRGGTRELRSSPLILPPLRYGENQEFEQMPLRQAMPSGGTLVIDGENCGEENGDFVKINFRDHGVGISPQYLDAIFDPYFTTKQTGSGLGLATVHSIVKKHNGHISVKSAPGEGAVFTLHLPADRTLLQAETDTPSENSDGISLKPGRALVMDDEEIVQMVVTEMLKELGYETESAYDGGEALQKYQEAIAAGRPFSFVLMDLTIPGGMGGKEAAQKLLAIDPSARMIVYIGYSNDPVVAHFAEYGFQGRFVKPFKLEELKKELKGLG